MACSTNATQESERQDGAARKHYSGQPPAHRRVSGISFGRQFVRGGHLQTRNLSAALTALRPYRNGAIDEPIDALLNRIRRDIGLQDESGELEDMEEADDALSTDVDHAGLEELIQLGLLVLKEAGDSSGI